MREFMCSLQPVCQSENRTGVRALGATVRGTGCRVAWPGVWPLALRAACVAALGAAAAVAAASAVAQPLPPSIQAALTRSGLPADSLALLVAPARTLAAPVLSVRANQPVNPASVMKLVTTYAAVDVLGPAFRWRTGFYADGPVADGVLRGNLHIQGGGDPKWVMERITEALLAVQAQGVRVVRGDIVLDQSAFNLPPIDPAAFDGEHLRPYNATPEALLVNFKSLVLGLVPDDQAGVARVTFEPPLAGVRVDASVPLTQAPCADWRTALRAEFDDPDRVRLGGSYSRRCGERSWPVAYVDPARFAARAIEGLWRANGGLMTGEVRQGPVPASARLLHEAWSLPLQDIVADVNGFSNNIMAQQVFLTLGRVPESAVGAGSSAQAARREPALVVPATPEGARQRLGQWWLSRFGPRLPGPVLVNGSGLSRDERITAEALVALLRDAVHHPNGPAWAQTLPVAGVSGTAARMGARGILKNALGNARIKTGSLRDVVSVAGYVNGVGGEVWAVVAIANHPEAERARPVLDAVLEWAANLPRP